MGRQQHGEETGLPDLLPAAQCGVVRYASVQPRQPQAATMPTVVSMAVRTDLDRQAELGGSIGEYWQPPPARGILNIFLPTKMEPRLRRAAFASARSVLVAAGASFIMPPSYFHDFPS